MQQAWKKMSRQFILENLKQVECSRDQGARGKTNIKADL
jgi:hypothetical protein